MYTQNRKFRLVAILAVILVLLCSGCVPKNADTQQSITPGTKETTVFIASDVHLYSKNLVGEDNKTYVKANFSADGRAQEYDYSLVEALVGEVNKQNPEFLVLTGDLSFNGEEDSHTELARLLGKIEKTKVLVIPGNHDTYSLSAFSAKEDTLADIDSITAEDFRQIYNNFGYSGAYSYDEQTLSYIYPLNSSTWALMLDTTLSKYNEENDYNIVGGFVEEPTLIWLEENLKYAKENGISVVAFSHHNLLVHNELFKSSYTVTNYELLLELYRKYNVNLNFSGHLHIQSIKSQTTGEQTIYDVVSGSLLDYGNRYGQLDIYDNCYSYEARLLDFADREKTFKIFCDEYYAKTVAQYKTALGEKKGEAAAALLSEINAYYFDGDYRQIHQTIKENKSLVKKIKKNTKKYETSYVKSILETQNKNQHTLLITRNINGN